MTVLFCLSNSPYLDIADIVGGGIANSVSSGVFNNTINLCCFVLMFTAVFDATSRVGCAEKKSYLAQLVLFCIM